MEFIYFSSFTISVNLPDRKGLYLALISKKPSERHRDGGS